MNKRYMQLPKGYLSYSALTLWMDDPKKFAGIYFDGRDELRTSNAALEYGKVVADALEKGIGTGDLLTDAAMLMLPKYDIADKEIIVEFKDKQTRSWIRLLGRPDTMDSKTYAFGEYKTGKLPWTQERAEKHLQLKYYAMIIYLKFGVVAPKVDLIWIQTEQTPEGIKPTGHVQSFPVTIGLKDILDTMSLTAKVAREIEIAWASHVPDKRLVW